MIKNIFTDTMSRFIAALGRTKSGGIILDHILNSAMDATHSITHNKTQLVFVVPNRLNRSRVDSFSTKEPETLEWIDKLPEESVVWDIGANIGLYSCYAAKSKGCKVFAFEPSVFNLDVLAKNIFLNNVTSNVTIIPIPLSNKMAFSTLNMTSTERGSALSTFGQDFGWDGKDIQRAFAFQTIGLSADDALTLLSLPQPNYIKLDVDGIEHLILSGARAVLSKVDGVLIEVNDNFQEQAIQSSDMLQASGLVLLEKRHSEVFDQPDSFGGGMVWNQIWARQ